VFFDGYGFGPRRIDKPTEAVLRVFRRHAAHNTPNRIIGNFWPFWPIWQCGTGDLDGFGVCLSADLEGAVGPH
jgi:hypothetical protein